MGYKIDPITGQMIKSENDQSRPTTKQFNSRDYIGYSDNFDKQSPEVSKLDSIVPVKSQQLDDLGPKSIEPRRMDALANLMRSPASDSLRSIQAQKLKNQEDYLNRPPTRDDEDNEDIDLSNLKQGTKAHEHRILAQGLEMDDDQDAHLQDIGRRIEATQGSDKEALRDEYDQYFNKYRLQNKDNYWKNK